VGRGRLRSVRPAHGLVYGSLDDLLTEMMPPLDSASRVDAALPRVDVMKVSRVERLRPGSVRLRSAVTVANANN
jgi:hypothetical protein